MGEEWVRELGQWCTATCAPETPAQRYAAIPLERWGPHTRPRRTMIRGAGPDHLWDAVKPVRTPVAILGSLGVCIYVPASRHWLISYSPIHLN